MAKASKKIATKFLVAAAKKRFVFLNSKEIALKAKTTQGMVYDAIYDGPGISAEARKRVLRVLGL